MVLKREKRAQHEVWTVARIEGDIEETTTMKYLSIVNNLLLFALSGALPGRLPGAEGDLHRPSAHTPAAPCRRVVQNGHYALAFDTDTLRIPRFGPVSGGVGYLTTARADRPVNNVYSVRTTS